MISSIFCCHGSIIIGISIIPVTFIFNLISSRCKGRCSSIESVKEINFKLLDSNGEIWQCRKWHCAKYNPIESKCSGNCQINQIHGNHCPRHKGKIHSVPWSITFGIWGEATLILWMLVKCFQGLFLLLPAFFTPGFYRFFIRGELGGVVSAIMWKELDLLNYLIKLFYWAVFSVCVQYLLIWKCTSSGTLPSNKSVSPVGNVFG